MSYSFQFRADSKDEVEAMVEEKFDEIVEQQEIHDNDRGTVEDAISAALDLVRDADDKQISVTVSGSCSKRVLPAAEDADDGEDDEDAEDEGLESVSFSVTLMLVDPE